MRLLNYLMPIIFILALSIESQADTADHIKKILDDRDQMIKELLGPKGTSYTDEQREKLKSIINDMVDYPAMAQVALDDHYDKISAEEREEFNTLFANVIRQHSLGQLDIYRAEVVYNEIEVDGNTAHVNTTAILDNVRTPVRYRMHKKDGEWLIADMSVDNLWTAESYRRSFQNIIRRRGFDALLDSLRRRAEG